MRIAFIVQRKNYFKYFGSLIRAAATRGWDCEVWLFNPGSSKAYLDVTLETIPQTLQKLVKPISCTNESQLHSLLKSGPEVIFSLHPRSYYKVPAIVGTLFITLQHGLDTFIESTPGELTSSDAIVMYSRYWMDMACQYYQFEGYGSKDDIYIQLEPYALFTGTPQLDLVEDLNAEEIRAEYGIPPQKKVVLLLPINLTYWPGVWPRFFAAQTRIHQLQWFLTGIRKEGLAFLKYWRWAVKGWNDKRLSRAVRDFCDKNNAVFVAKARRKDPFRTGVLETADITLFDEEFYPSTILKLMSISDVCIHFYSSAVLEAAVCGSFGICVDRPNLETGAHSLWRKNDVGHVFNWPGVNLWKSLPETIEHLGEQRIDDLEVDRISRANFIKTFLSGGQVAEKLMDHVSAHFQIIAQQVE